MRGILYFFAGVFAFLWVANHVTVTPAPPVAQKATPPEASKSCYEILGYHPEDKIAKRLMADNYLTEVECDAYVKVLNRRREREEFNAAKQKTLAQFNRKGA